MKYQHGFFMRMHQICFVHWSPFSTRFSKKAFVPSLWKSANALPIPKSSPALLTSTLTLVYYFPYSYSLYNHEVIPLLLASSVIINQIDPLHFGSLQGLSASMALVTSFISGRKRIMTLDHPYGSAYLAFQKPSDWSCFIEKTPANVCPSNHY